MAEENLTHKEFSALGGQKTLATRGKEFIEKIAAQGGKNTSKRYGPEHYRRIQKLSVESRKKKQNNKKQAQVAVLTSNR